MFINPEFSRRELDSQKKMDQVCDEARKELGSDYPHYAIGRIEFQRETAVKIARDAIDEVERLRKQLSDAEDIIESQLGWDDDTPQAKYWDTHNEV